MRCADGEKVTRIRNILSDMSGVLYRGKELICFPEYFYFDYESRGSSLSRIVNQRAMSALRYISDDPRSFDSTEKVLKIFLEMATV